MKRAFSSLLILLTFTVSAQAFAALDASCSKEIRFGISLEQLKHMAREYDDNLTPAQKRINDNVQMNGIKKTALNLDIVNDTDFFFTRKVEYGKTSDQKRSGRCWIFASLEIFRNRLMKLKIFKKDDEFSQSYLHFFNMFEKANRYLEKVIRAEGQRKANKLSDRLFRDEVELDKDQLGDGGEFAWFVFLVQKYGLVPKSVYGETASSENTDALLEALRNKLAEFAIEMHHTVENIKVGANGKFSEADLKKLESIKMRAMRTVFFMLSTALGRPPMPDDEITVYKAAEEPKDDAAKEAAKTKPVNPEMIQTTPKTFMKDIVKFDPDEFVTISSTPLQPYNQTYKIKNSAIGESTADDPRRDLTYLNLPKKRMKELMKAMTDANMPYYFAAEVSHNFNPAERIAHPELYKTEDLWGLPKSLQRKRRLSWYEQVRMGVTAAVHAMAGVAYDDRQASQDPKNDDVFDNIGIKNSWGPIEKSGIVVSDDNTIVASSGYVDENVFEVVVHRSVLGESEVNLLKKKPKTIKSDKDYYGVQLIHNW